MGMDVEYQLTFEKIPAPRPLAVVRRVARLAELPRVVPEACGLVWEALKKQGVKGAGRHVAVYWDEVINLEVGVEMDGPFAGAGEVIASALPVGHVAHTVHMGPYPRL